MTEKPQPNRWRCLATGCNPKLNEATAQDHREDTGHRVAKWPVRSKEGKRRARERNKNGYYDRYNVGPKDRTERALAGHLPYHEPSGDEHPFSSEGHGQW